MTDPIVRQIDHLMIETSDPRKLFDLFSVDLGLPEAWPLKSFGPFTSGGVSAGNVNLELIRFDTSRFGRPIDPTDKIEGARLTGVAFEPSRNTDESIAALEKQGIKHGTPQTTPNWTNTQILGLLDKPGIAFLSEFHFDYLGWRKSLSEKLTARRGGALGIRRVSDLIVETNAQAAWRQLLGNSSEGSSISVGTGPSICLTTGARNSLSGIRCEVSSLAQARLTLAKLDLHGLRIELIQA